ncbi:hypothetical protein CLOM_g13001 [Closterium sp. NIES-68]|nr:hypothetical protein CLOM_g13001 [Closterium sp. NIES-68]GJP72138.1 hypothetical protein CLOP_g2894 [Closterium sp. NIES-67]GJP86204.1 hypothetical protein CLOP_g16256 [Closterium sp. NIES-67]
MGSHVSLIGALLLMVFLGLSLSASEAARPYCRFDGKLVVSNLVKELSAAGNYSTLLAALKKTDLDDDLPALFNCYEATLFAPTDAAFEELSSDARSAIKDAKVLREVVLLHVVQKKMTAADLAALPQGKQLKAAAGGCKARLVKVSPRGAQPVEVEAMDGPQGASLVAPDVISLRVVQVHGVDDVILPKSLQKGDGDSLKPGKCLAWRA